MEEYKLDFDDALIVACMRKRKIDNLISFDEHFKKVKEIKLLKPQQKLRNHELLYSCFFYLF